MQKDQSITVQELCELIPDVSKTCINKTLTDHLRYAKVCARWVPRMLMEDHNALRWPVNFFPPTKPTARNSRTLLSPGTRPGCTTPHQKRNNNPISGNIKSRRSHSSSNKHLLLPKWWRVFFGRVVRIHACRLKQKEVHAHKGVRFHQDNARPHITHVTNNLIKKFGWDTVTQPRYSPRWLPCLPRIEETNGWDAFEKWTGAWWDSSTTQAWGTWYITCKNELLSMAIMLKNGGKFKLSVNVLFNANKHVAHCEK